MGDFAFFPLASHALRATAEVCLSESAGGGAKRSINNNFAFVLGSKLNFPGVPLFLVVVLYVLPFGQSVTLHTQKDTLSFMGSPKKMT